MFSSLKIICDSLVVIKFVFETDGAGGGGGGGQDV